MRCSIANADGCSFLILDGLREYRDPHTASQMNSTPSLEGVIVGDGWGGEVLQLLLSLSCLSAGSARLSSLAAFSPGRVELRLNSRWLSRSGCIARFLVVLAMLLRRVVQRHNLRKSFLSLRLVACTIMTSVIAGTSLQTSNHRRQRRRSGLLLVATTASAVSTVSTIGASVLELRIIAEFIRELAARAATTITATTPFNRTAIQISSHVHLLQVSWWCTSQWTI